MKENAKEKRKKEVIYIVFTSQEATHAFIMYLTSRDEMKQGKGVVYGSRRSGMGWH